MKTSEKIINYIKAKEETTPQELADTLEIGKRAVFKQLKKLYELNVIDKRGRPPRVFYFIKPVDSTIEEYKLETEEKECIEKNYLIITPTGEELKGLAGFAYWCRKNNLPVKKTAGEYLRTFNKYAKYKKKTFINGTYKLKNTFDRVFVDKLYYLDFYSIERFGKTKLGWSLLYAKQSQDKMLIKRLILTIKPPVNALIKRHQINAVGFVPPTVKRETQFMLELAKNLKLTLPVISIRKVKTPIVVPQKTLNKLTDRIENAQNTFMVDDNRSFGNVLLIDDAVGSGSTLNEIARKIKQRGVARKIFALAITGSFKGFEIISEV